MILEEILADLAVLASKHPELLPILGTAVKALSAGEDPVAALERATIMASHKKAVEAAAKLSLQGLKRAGVKPPLPRR